MDGDGRKKVVLQRRNLDQAWFAASGPSGNNWEDDESFYAWKRDPKDDEERLKELLLQKAIHQVRKVGESPLGLQALLQGLATLLGKVEPSSRAKLEEEIKQIIGFAKDNDESSIHNFSYEIFR